MTRVVHYGEATAEPSPRYHSNPSFVMCLYCDRPMGHAEFGHLTRERASEIFGEDMATNLQGEEDDLQAPDEIYITAFPCPECPEFLENTKDSVYLVQVVTVEPGGETEDELHPSLQHAPTGVYALVDESVVPHLVPSSLVGSVMRQRIAAIDVDAWEHLGLSSATPEEC